MKKVLFFMAMALTCAFATAQTNQVVWLNGKVLYGHPITTIDSMTYDMNGMMEGDTLHLIMPRSTVYVVHDTVVKTNTVYVKDTIYINKCGSEGQGVFSVSADKQVSFAKGNLQYTRSTQTWSFADNQYDMIGTDNVDGGTEQLDAEYGYSKSGSTLADKIDLFGWSGSTGSAKWGIGTSQSNSDYSGDFVDWGTNTIGTDAPNTWRTLTYDEWYYLRNTRSNADNLVGVARINLNADGSEYANGLVLLPDDWTCPAGVTFKSGFSDTYSVQAYADYQTFTLADWQQLEAAGAVFLPASGYRDGSDVDGVRYGGDFWSATPDVSGYANVFYFFSNGARTGYYWLRYVGQAVRLVKNYSNVSTDAARPSAAETTPDRKVLRNGQVLIQRNGKTYTLTGIEVK